VSATIRARASRCWQTTAMSFSGSPSEQLTTRQAAALTGRSQDAVKSAIRHGHLAGTRQIDGWRVIRKDVLAWQKATRAMPRPSSRPWERAAALLEDYGSLSTEELTVLLDRHPGNCRKYLALLRAEHRVQQLDDGQWVLTKRKAGVA
jgi:hypothetical protein